MRFCASPAMDQTRIGRRVQDRATKTQMVVAPIDALATLMIRADQSTPSVPCAWRDPSAARVHPLRS